MVTTLLNTWRRNAGEAAICRPLNRELLTLVHGQKATADRLVNLEKLQHPGHTEHWYLEKCIYDLQRGR